MTKIHRYLWLCFVAVFCTIQFVYLKDIWAQGLEPLPALEKITAEDFVKETKIVTKTFEDDQYVELEYQIHSDWEDVQYIKLKNVVRSGRLYGTIAEHLGPVLDNIQPYFRVMTHEVDREISAKNWFINFILSNGYTLKSFEAQNFDDEYEAFYVKREDIDSYAVRVKGKKIGPRIVMAEYAIPGQYWGRYRDYQTLVIKSMRIDGYDPKHVEDRKFFAYLDDIGFEYPESWRLFPEVLYGPNKLRVDVVNSIDGQSVIGQIRVHLISSRMIDSLEGVQAHDVNVKDDVKDIRAHFEKDYKIKDLIEKKQFIVGDDVKFQATDIYGLEEIRSEYETFEIGQVKEELWFSVFARGTNYYVVTMLTPHRERESYNWAINSKAFEIIVESMLKQKIIDDDF